LSNTEISSLKCGEIFSPRVLETIRAREHVKYMINRALNLLTLKEQVQTCLSIYVLITNNITKGTIRRMTSYKVGNSNVVSQSIVMQLKQEGFGLVRKKIVCPNAIQSPRLGFINHNIHTRGKLDNVVGYFGWSNITKYFSQVATAFSLTVDVCC
jgi:hypothetical protein